MELYSLWEKINRTIQQNSIELPTIPTNRKQPLWLRAYYQSGSLFVDNAEHHKPATKMNKPRKIIKDDFETVYSCYRRWQKGESRMRQYAQSVSKNTSYIFALISYYDRLQG